MKKQARAVLLLAIVLGSLSFGGGTAQAAGPIDLLDGSGVTLGSYSSVQACAAIAVAGQTCLVSGGNYDERVVPSNSGTQGNPITFKAASGVRPKVRGFSVSGKNFITIEGFEITHQGMTSEASLNAFSSIMISGGSGVRLVNNRIHDTCAACIGYGNTNQLEIRENEIDHCGVANAIVGEASGTFHIVGGESDTLRFKINGGSSYTITLTPGQSQTSNQICNDIHAVVGYQVLGAMNSASCHGEAADGRLHIHPYALGPTATIEVESVAANAYAALGMTVGRSVPVGHAAAFQALGQESQDVLIEGNRVSRVSDYLLPRGNRFVLRNNTLGPSDPVSAIHIDGVQSNAPVNALLIEGNTQLENASSDNHFLLTSANSNNWIIRYNVSLRSKGGQSWGCGSCGTLNQWAHYNNTWYDNYAYYGAPSSNSQLGLINSKNNVSRNNIWYRSVRSNVNPYYLDSASTLDRDYDLWFETGSPQVAHGVNVDPLFVNPSSGDFRLQGESAAIDKGGALTITTNSGLNSRTLQVTNAAPFQAGWAGVAPDWIAVDNPSQSVQISSIDYTMNTIMLASPLSWASGSSVWLFKKSDGMRVLYGAAPDIGAREYQPLSSAPSSPQNLRLSELVAEN